jgi:hypothetical protein
MTAIKPGGWKKVKTGKRVGTREIEATVSKRVFTFTGAALIDREVGIEKGTQVRITQLYGCPPAGTMGQCYVAEAETPYTFLGMVSCGSLEAA